MNEKQVLSIIVEMGHLFLKYGAEVYRAEQSVAYISKSYGLELVDVFAIPSTIIVTVTTKDDYITKTQRINNATIDLYRVELLNSLSRDICEHKLTYNQILECLEQIKTAKTYSSPIRVLALSLSALSFTILFGGTLFDSIASFFVGFFAALVSVLLDETKMNGFLKTATVSFSISVFAYSLTYLFMPHLSAQAIMSGALMMLVPGLAFTNCMRDIMANDYVSGLSKLTEALMTALAVAVGVSVVLLTIY